MPNALTEKREKYSSNAKLAVAVCKKDQLMHLRGIGKKNIYITKCCSW
jgi:hypothetical protein